MYVWTEYYKNELIVNSLPLVQDGLAEIVKRISKDCQDLNDLASNEFESLDEFKQFCDEFNKDPRSYTQKLFNHSKFDPIIIDLNSQSLVFDLNYQGLILDLNITITKTFENRLEITASSNVNEPWQVRITYLNG